MAPTMRNFLNTNILKWKFICDCFNNSSNKFFFRYIRGSRSGIRGDGLNNTEIKFNRMLQSIRETSKVENANESLGCENKSNFSNQERAATVTKIPTLENQYELLSEKVTPYYKEPYTRQLELKYKKSFKVLQQLGKRLEDMKVPIALGTDKLPCPLDVIIPSPETEVYRNKDEFSVHCGIDGNSKTVGFYLEKSLENPSTICVSPEKLIIIKDSHKALVNDFENYIRQSSLPAFINFDENGFWKNLVIRSNSIGEVMGVIICHPQQRTEEELNSEKQRIKDYFSTIGKDKYQLKSLYFQACPHTRCTHEQAPFELLLGEQYIIEESNGLKFKISPESFFQTNTKAAANMYASLLKICKVKRSASVLDICCGTGPISLLFASKVKKCIGIDVSSQAISDAKINASLNNVHNVEFHQGRCEHVLKEIFNKEYFEEIIAVINPGRGALSSSAINTLRQCRYLKKIIYISCKASGAMDNYVQLCKPPGNRQDLGKPFLPIWSVPADLFPHTEHYELMVMFQRL